MIKKIVQKLKDFFKPAPMKCYICQKEVRPDLVDHSIQITLGYSGIEWESCSSTKLPQFPFYLCKMHRKDLEEYLCQLKTEYQDITIERETLEGN